LVAEAVTDAITLLVTGANSRHDPIEHVGHNNQSSQRNCHLLARYHSDWSLLNDTITAVIALVGCCGLCRNERHVESSAEPHRRGEGVFE